jgi:hypothetical protein
VTKSEAKKYLAIENAKWPRVLAPVPPEDWPAMPPGWQRPIAVLRSMTFLVQVFDEQSGLRMTVNRTVLEDWRNGPIWREGISWEEMQTLKRQAGFNDRWAVEVFPSDGDVVNVANMRHLWILDEPPSYGWHRKAMPRNEMGTQRSGATSESLALPRMTSGRKIG